MTRKLGFVRRFPRARKSSLNPTSASISLSAADDFSLIPNCALNGVLRIFCGGTLASPLIRTPILASLCGVDEARLPINEHLIAASYARRCRPGLLFGTGGSESKLGRPLGDYSNGSEESPRAAELARKNDGHDSAWAPWPLKVASCPPTAGCQSISTFAVRHSAAAGGEML